MDNEMTQLKQLIKLVSTDKFSDSVPILNQIVEAKTKKLTKKVIDKNFAKNKVIGN